MRVVYPSLRRIGDTVTDTVCQQLHTSPPARSTIPPATTTTTDRYRNYKKSVNDTSGFHSDPMHGIAERKSLQDTNNKKEKRNTIFEPHSSRSK